jgi:hypothetical protein
MRHDNLGLWNLVHLLACGMLMGCGGEVVVEPNAHSEAVGSTTSSGGATSSGGSDGAGASASSSGGSGGAGVSVASSGGSGGAGASDPSATGSTGAAPGGECDGQACGMPCDCGPDCPFGLCDGSGSCVPLDFESPEQCPPADQVTYGGACVTQALACDSNESCSGVLVCDCGVWTLFNPC